MLIIPIAASAQLRNRWGWHVGVADFPAWRSGYIFDGQTPHGDIGLHTGPSYLIPIDKQKSVIFSAGIASHLFHFHIEDGPDGYFRNSFLNANFTFNEEFEIKIRRNYYDIKVLFGVGLISSGLLKAGNTTENDFYQTEVISTFFIEPELIAGIGYVFKQGSHLFHLNLAYHFDPFKIYEFRLQYQGNRRFTQYNNYQYLLLEIIAFPQIVIKKKKQKWSLCR